ncbi:uncharacterized protein (DUF1330 family) [Streptomyces sp. SLBN-118]|uniref:DUF1330 domain-containing protein n=1 Tax=Streptomyces sp. SLBN-118 TaxID=2768454 RepID=UPI0011506C7A|nr:DUF1330 domain-containing protein [Streptomyces sp. SLBN-118]TQK52243.1 uncharacterized protein (DUF1330 family) [Streptomyces sp. SLBN-118]
MSAYAIGHLLPPARLDDEIFLYMERIQSTLDPFGGRFLVHGATVEVREGEWPGALVIIGFPGLEEARDWYESEAYQELVPLRTRHMAGDVVLVEGVAPGYDASLTADRLRQEQEQDQEQEQEQAPVS